MRAALAMLAALALIPTALAHDESAAPSLRSDVEAVWHEPEVPAPGTQWEGYIRFTPDHNITAVAYQICKVGIACFAPPTAAEPVDARTWTFHTSDYLANGRPVAWGIEDGQPWRVGVQYILTLENGTQELLPHGIAFGSPECDELGNVACSETHYLAFDMPGAKPAGNDTPWAPAAPLVAVALALALRRRGGA